MQTVHFGVNNSCQGKSHSWANEVFYRKSEQEESTVLRQWNTTNEQTVRSFHVTVYNRPTTARLFLVSSSRKFEETNEGLLCSANVTRWSVDSSCSRFNSFFPAAMTKQVVYLPSTLLERARGKSHLIPARCVIHQQAGNLCTAPPLPLRLPHCILSSEWRRTAHWGPDRCLDRCVARPVASYCPVCSPPRTPHSARLTAVLKGS